MRWIFLVLLAANAALFGWYWSELDRADRLKALNVSVHEDRPMPGSRLVLVKELTEQQKLDLGKLKDKIVDQEKTAPVAVVPAPVTAVVQKEAPSPLVEPVAESTPPSVAAAKTTSDQCVMLGPVKDKQQGQQVTQRLAAVSIHSDIREISVEGGVEFWVILPPADDNKAALKKLLELQGRSIDGQIIPQGELANAISLGLYGQRANAEKRLTEVKSMGYPNALIRERPRVFKESWVMLTELSSLRLTQELWLGIHEDFPSLDKRSHPCP